MAGTLKYGPVVKDLKATIVVVDDAPEFSIEAAHFKAHSAHLTGYNSVFNSTASARSFMAGFVGADYVDTLSDVQVMGWLRKAFAMKRRQVWLAPVYDKRSDRAIVPVGLFGPHPEYFRLEDLTEEETPVESFGVDAWQSMVPEVEESDTK